LSSRRIRGTSCRPEDTSPKDLRDPSLIAQGDKKITQGDKKITQGDTVTANVTPANYFYIFKASIPTNVP